MARVGEETRPQGLRRLRNAASGTEAVTFQKRGGNCRRTMAEPPVPTAQETLRPPTLTGFCIQDGGSIELQCIHNSQNAEGDLTCC